MREQVGLQEHAQLVAGECLLNFYFVHWTELPSGGLELAHQDVIDRVARLACLNLRHKVLWINLLNIKFLAIPKMEILKHLLLLLFVLQ